MPEASLAPTLLVAMPQLDDPNFNRTVVLLCRADDDGAMGLVLNRPTETLVSEVVDFDPPLAADNRACTWIGGPVEPQHGWLLHGAIGQVGASHDGDAAREGGRGYEVAPGVFISGSLSTLRRFLEDEQPEPCRFLLGYAGWGRGQLESEIAESAWLTVDPSAELIFATPAERLWEAAIRRLGIEPFALQSGSGVH